MQGEYDKDRLFQCLRSYVEENYIAICENVCGEEREDACYEAMPRPMAEVGGGFFSRPSLGTAKVKRTGLAEANLVIQKPFHEYLYQLITERGYTLPEFYDHKIFMSKQTFHKIINGKKKKKKRTAVIMALALELNLDETRDFLARAGYALSPSDLGDVIIQFCIENGNYDFAFIDDAFAAYGLAPLIVEPV